jgi:hypothetical protein
MRYVVNCSSLFWRTLAEAVEGRVMDDQRFPLTFQQEFYMRALRSGRALNHRFPLVYRLEGRLDPEVFKVSLIEVRRRHSALQMRVISTGDNEWCWVCADDESRSIYVCPQLEPAAAQISSIEEIVQGILDKEVDLEKENLFKAQLHKVSLHEHFLILEIHHLILDPHAAHLILKDLWSMVLQLLAGVDVGIISGVPQYSDYAMRQRRNDSSWIEAHGQYWEGHRARFPPICWPQAQCAGSGIFEGHASLTFSFGAGIVESLRTLARQEGTSLSVVVLTTYVIAVSRICGMNKFVVPFNSLGRGSSFDSRTVGYFAFILYVSLHVVSDKNFRVHLKRVHMGLMMALSHEDFGRIAAMEMETMNHGLFTWYPASRGEYGCESEIKQMQRRGIGVSSVPLTSAIRFPSPKVPLYSLDITFSETIEAWPGGVADVLGTIQYVPDMLSVELVERLVGEMKAVAGEAL